MFLLSQTSLNESTNQWYALKYLRVENIEYLIPAEKNENSNDVEIGRVQKVDFVWYDYDQTEHEREDWRGCESTEFRHGCNVEHHTVTVGVSVQCGCRWNLQQKKIEKLSKPGLLAKIIQDGQLVLAYFLPGCNVLWSIFAIFFQKSRKVFWI